MSWPKASKEKEALLDELVEGLPCEKKRMFGAPVCFAKHSMFAGVFAEDIFIRLPDEERGRFLKENKGAKAFEPVEGRKMGEYLVAPHALLKNKPAMREWLRISFDYAATLKKK
jgi:TfoX/Sxy family transcriptional regulator of competence genes